MNEPFRLGYRPALEGLRAVAVLLVMGRHTNLILPGTAPVLVGGWIGVDVFFVLSGFLISSLLLQERRETGGIDLVRFFWRRTLRLGPAVALMVLYFGLCFWPNMSLLGIATGHYWSLQIEWVFYLAWAPALMIALRLRRSALLMGVLFGVGIAWTVGLRAGLFLDGYDTRGLYGSPLTRSDGLLLGGVLAASLHWGWIAPGRWTRLRVVGPASMLGLGALAFIVPPWETTALYLGGFTGIAVLSALAVLYLLASPSRLVASLLLFRPVLYLGRISYGVYLWHLPLFIVAGVVLEGAHPAVAVLGGVLSTVAVAAVSWHYVERPLLAGHGRFHRATRRTFPSAAAAPE
jgi:peptidoglycan/LPS O-acetylase OafA/YrhL